MPTTRLCEWCHQQPVDQNGRLGVYRYCSEPCRRQAYLESERCKRARRRQQGTHLRGQSRPTDRTCPWCGRSFHRPQRNPSNYCTTMCRNADHATVTSEVLPWATCLSCHRWFLARNRQLCPQADCQRARRRLDYTPRWRPCLTCGTPCPQGRHHCDADCRRADPQWQRQQRDRERRRELRKRVSGDDYERQEIFGRDGWRCHLCRRKCRQDVGPHHPKAATIDHIIPLTHGGQDVRANVATAHRQCNNRKSARSANDQLRLIG